MTFPSSIEPWAESLIGWALQDVPNRVKRYPQDVCSDATRLPPFWGALMHGNNLTGVEVLPMIKDTGIELLILYGPSKKTYELLFVSAVARSVMVIRDWRKYCRAFVFVEFSAKSSRLDFLVMDTAAFAATGRARAELLQKKFACRIDWQDWDCALGTNFAQMAQSYSDARDTIVKGVMDAAILSHEGTSAPP